VAEESLQKRYEQVDLPFYREHVAPLLPGEVLDFHAHTWLRAHWRAVPWKGDQDGGAYMVTVEDYDVGCLMADGNAMFPDRTYRAVCFGYPAPCADLTRSNAYTAEARSQAGFFPLMLVRRDEVAQDELRRQLIEGGFFGYKVCLTWFGDDYGESTVADMIGPAEMELADELRLVVLLHVPRSGRLADPQVQEGVRALARQYPHAALVLAHCGRCYHPDQFRAAVGAIEKLENVHLDTSMVMDPLVLQMAFERLGPARILFGTDLPVAAMRGRRVYVMDHWVDVVLPGYPASAFRVPAEGIRATFMAWEIVLAIRRAGEAAGIGESELAGVFHDNGMALLRRVAIPPAEAANEAGA